MEFLKVEHIETMRLEVSELQTSQAGNTFCRASPTNETWWRIQHEPMYLPLLASASLATVSDG